MNLLCTLWTKITSLTMAALFTVVAMGQGVKTNTKSKAAEKLFSEGLIEFNKSEYRTAYDSFNKASVKDPEFAEAWMMMGESAYALRDYKLAAENFSKASLLSDNRYPIAHILEGGAWYLAGEYRNGLEAYNRFLALGNSKENLRNDATRGAAQCSFALYATTHPVPFKPQRMSDYINTSFDEYWPSLTADEKTILYTALVPGKDELNPILQEDFFLSKQTGDEWQPAYNMGMPINTPGNEGAQALSPDGRIIYFTACSRPDGSGMCDLYDALLNDGRWEHPRNLGPPVNTNRSEKNPSISADGSVLWFSSDRPGGYGNMDIWFTQKKPDGQWGIPQNAGDSINTPDDDISPFIHPDNRTLYYASNGRIGMGGLDLYLCRLDSAGKPLSVANLGYPINTNRDEIGLFVTASGKRAYYSSDIATGNQDIFWFDLPAEIRPMPVSYCKGLVFDRITNAPLKAAYLLTDLATGDTLLKATTDGSDGSFLVCLPTDHDYGLHIAGSGYLFHSENFSLKGIQTIDKPYEISVGLIRPLIGNSVVLNNIFFEFNSYKLSDKSESELKTLVAFLLNNPGLKIEIGGYTDTTGTEIYNQQLSEKRAREVYLYLTEQGISPNRLSYKGYGEDIINPETESGLRRKTTFTVTGI